MIQVKKEHYLSKEYDSLERFKSYWYQKELIYETGIKNNILEIGIGNSFMYNYLKSRGFKIETMDFDKKLKPDYHCDIRNIRIKKRFNVILVSEVLEHILFKDLDLALGNIFRILDCNGFFISSVPIVPLPLPMKILYNQQHYWELGKLGYSKERFLNKIRKRFKIIKTIKTRIMFFVVAKKIK